MAIGLMVSCEDKAQIQNVENRQTTEYESFTPTPATQGGTENKFEVNVDEKFVGVYLPIPYIELIKKSKNHSTALHSDNGNYHSLLIAHPKIIYSDLKWHDGYAIKKEDVDRFEFKSVVETTITDNNGYQYLRISEKVEGAYGTIENYIINTILYDLINHGDLLVEGNTIEIQGKKFEVILDENFFEPGNNLMLREKNENLVLGLKIMDKKYTFYKIARKGKSPEMINTDEIVYEFNIE